MEETRWRKSSWSEGASNCVEVANTSDELRDSKNPGVTLSVAPAALAMMLRSVSR